MFKFKKTAGKLLTAAVLAAAFSMMPLSSAYADGPSGPASDTSIAGNSKQEATGPGAQNSAAQQGGQTAGQVPDQQGGQTAGQVPDQQGGQAAGQVPGQQAGQAAGQVPDQQNGQAQTPPAELPDAQTGTQEATDGKVLSGGRWIDPSKPMIALTFDDGPYAPVGNRIMDCLEQHNGRSTFFVVGSRVPQYKTEIKRMHDNGHEVGNHTYEHKYLTKLGAEAIRSQIERCNEAVAAVTGEAPKLVRLPGGLKNATVLANVNYPMIMWNIDTMDWKTKNAQKTINAVIGKVQDGDIVLMHELYTASGDAAEVIIPALSEQGYQLVTVSEMASFRGGAAAGRTYNKFRP